MVNCKVIQIYYDKKQLDSLYQSEYIYHVYNPAPKKYNFEDQYYVLENKIIADQVPLLDAHYVGVWSHKHYEKLIPNSADGTFNKKDNNKDQFVDWFESRVDKKDFDILGFHRMWNNLHRKHMLTRANEWHPNFKNALQHLIKKSGVKLNLNPPYNFITLMNYQVARKEIYFDYISTVLRPILNAMLDKNDKQLQDWLHTDSKYEGAAKNEGTLLRIGNRPYYTLHTFILERLFTLYLNSRNFKCVNY